MGFRHWTLDCGNGVGGQIIVGGRLIGIAREKGRPESWPLGQTNQLGSENTQRCR